MNHLTQARTDIAQVLQQIKDDWTEYELVVETNNREAADQTLQKNPYLNVKTRFISAQQIDLSETPRVTQYGQIVLSAVCREGQGQAKADSLLEFVAPYFDMKDFSLVRCHAVEIHEGVLRKGWWFSPAVVNFWYLRSS